MALGIYIEYVPRPGCRDAHAAKPGHSHAWQESLVESKRISVCTIVASPPPKN